jgi:hypothetical protein
MRGSHRLVVGGVIVALGMILAPPPAGAKREEDPNQRALSRLDAMAKLISKAKRLRTTVDCTWDVVQTEGEKIEFGETRTMTIRRPDRVRIEVANRDGSRRGFLFDGEQIAIFDLDQKVYATEASRGSLDRALDHVVEVLHVRVPLSELVSADLPKTLAPLRDSVDWVARETIAGTATDHLSLRGENVDVQVWLSAEGDPLPRRMVLTYHRDPGQPQFRAQFTEWNLSPEAPDELFAFNPADGAEKIPFVLPRTAAVPGAQR